MDELQRIPFNRSLYRPNLLLGGERLLVVLTGVISFGLALSDISLFKIALASIIWTVCIAFLRMLAKHDPQMSEAYLRNLKYKKFYPAQCRALD